MPHGTTSVSGPTAALGAHLELDLALDDLLGSRIRTLIRAGETARQTAPADLHDALKTIADGRDSRRAGGLFPCALGVESTTTS